MRRLLLALALATAAGPAHAELEWNEGYKPDRLEVYAKANPLYLSGTSGVIAIPRPLLAQVACAGVTSGNACTSGGSALTVPFTLGGISQGDLLYGSAADTVTRLAKDTNATRYLSNTGASNNPAWAQVNLTNGVTGTLPVTSGGLGIASGTSGGIPYFSAGTTVTSSAALGADQCVFGGGAGAAPYTDSNCAWNNTNKTLTLGAAGAGTGAVVYNKTMSGGAVTSNFLSATGTFPSTLTASGWGVNVQMTGAGSSNATSAAVNAEYLAGFTGTNGTYAGRFINNTNGTGNQLNNYWGTWGVLARGTAGTGYTGGLLGVGSGGTSPTGVAGYADGGTNRVGVAGSVAFSGTNHAGGLFALVAAANLTDFGFTGSSALIATNSSQAADILRCYDNVTLHCLAADGGDFYLHSGVAAVTTTATTTLATATTGSNITFTNTGDTDGATITLLNDPTAGVFYRFAVTAAQTLTIVASTGETLKHGASTCGTSLTSNTVGSTIMIMAVVGGSGGSWYTLGATGTWTCNA